ncbi:DUF952 domain-containing protein [Hamadaea tsunoensis]|uniref:DUF952 domain-containing protein n=1 Tax=Hamadaea tsunoensis TaxID=53368 RepID=UPI0004041EC7|nr:DUF952 domain-containing protein [Hamadaea tsunoensis]
MLIYKILLPEEWAEFQAAGRFDGSPFDHDSGFVHCSGRDQVARTARRFFADAPAIVLVALAADRLPVRWEQASDGVFPHVFGPLTAEAIEWSGPATPSTVEDALSRSPRDG